MVPGFANPAGSYRDTGSFSVDTRITYSGEIVFRVTSSSSNVSGQTSTDSWINFAGPIDAEPKPVLSKKELARMLALIWNRKCILEAQELERRALVPTKERAPRQVARSYSRYIKPVTKGRVCSSSSRYRTLVN